MAFRKSGCWKEIEQLRKKSRGVRGNFSLYQEKSDWLFETVRDSSPDKILETGFNCGHTSTIMLEAAKGTSLTTFDLFNNEFNGKAKSVIDKHHNGLTIVKGDTKSTLPKYFKEHPDEMFDFALIDGGHDYPTALSDLKAVLPHIKPGGYILIDDMNLKGVRKAHNEIDWSDFELVKKHEEARWTSPLKRDRDRIDNIALLYRRK